MFLTQAAHTAQAVRPAAGAIPATTHTPTALGESLSRAPRRADALEPVLARTVRSRAAGRAGGMGGLLQRVRITGGNVAGTPALDIQMVGVEIALGDNLRDPRLSLYTSGISECAALVTRCGTTLRLAHCVAFRFEFMKREHDTVLEWLGQRPDEVILVFGTKYAGPDAVARASHLVEQLLQESGYTGPVSRHYGADRFVVDPQGNVAIDPPHHVQGALPAAGGVAGKSGCCVLI